MATNSTFGKLKSFRRRIWYTTQTHMNVLSDYQKLLQVPALTAAGFSVEEWREKPRNAHDCGYLHPQPIEIYLSDSDALLAVGSLDDVDTLVDRVCRATQGVSTRSRKRDIQAASQPALQRADKDAAPPQKKKPTGSSGPHFTPLHNSTSLTPTRSLARARASSTGDSPGRPPRGFPLGPPRLAAEKPIVFPAGKVDVSVALALVLVLSLVLSSLYNVVIVEGP